MGSYFCYNLRCHLPAYHSLTQFRKRFSETLMSGTCSTHIQETIIIIIIKQPQDIELKGCCSRLSVIQCPNTYHFNIAQFSPNFHNYHSITTYPFNLPQWQTLFFFSLISFVSQELRFATVLLKTFHAYHFIFFQFYDFVQCDHFQLLLSQLSLIYLN